jgi:HEAT repeat protein
VTTDATAVLPPSQVAELIQSLVKALRAFQMYLPNNPIYQRAEQAVRAAFAPIWAATDELVLVVAETDFHWEEQVVYQQLSKSESLAWTLYKDGLRVLTLKSGVEESEIIQLLNLVNQARYLPTDAPDDLLTLLWEREFQWISYVFAEPFTEADQMEAQGKADPAVTPEARKEQVEQEAPRQQGVVELDDFDGTLYFLDESEINYIVQEVEREYGRDIRSSALAILFDLYELEPAPAVHEEILAILDSLFPNLLHRGDFQVVASILRELRGLGSRLPPEAVDDRARLDAFEARLSEPAIVRQLVQSLDESTIRAGDPDVRDVLAELKPAALETILSAIPELSSETVQEMLEATVDRLASENSAEVLRLLHMEDHSGLPALVEVCGRLRLQGAVPGLGDLLTHHSAELRLLATQALASVGTAGALSHLDRALEDADREVRVAAARALGARGYRNALRRIEAVVVQGKARSGMDLGERRAFFEAYGSIAGEQAIKPLAAMLEGKGLLRMKESPETRACAALALGRIGTAEARAVLERSAQEKDVVVRNAVRSALRGGGE